MDEEMVQEWAVKYSNVGVVLVGGGPLCQGVSGLNAHRKGALRDARSSLFGVAGEGEVPMGADPLPDGVSHSSPWTTGPGDHE